LGLDLDLGLDLGLLVVGYSLVWIVRDAELVQDKLWQEGPHQIPTCVM